MQRVVDQYIHGPLHAYRDNLMTHDIVAKLGIAIGDRASSYCIVLLRESM